MSSRNLREPARGLPTPMRNARVCVFCYSLVADEDPGLLSRVLEVFARRRLVPKRWVSDLIGSGAAALSIDCQVAGLDGREAVHLARCLGQIPGVQRVLFSEKGSGGLRSDSPISC